MKKALLLLLTVLTFSVTIAQEKQNDATWEETVKFLEENIRYLNGDTEYHSQELVIENLDKLIVSGKAFDNGNEWTYTLILKDIKKVFLSTINKNQIRLNAYGKVIKQNDGKLFPAIGIYYRNKEDMANRIIKAFKQIAYYNHQRQKESKF